MNAPFRIAVAGPGGLGLCAIREIQRLPELQLVGVLAYSSEKHGKDAGELAGIGPIGVRATTSFDEFLRLDAQCVIYTGRDYGDWRADAQILRLLEAGKNVITPLPYHYLKARGAEVEARFREACAKGGATLHGSGITPGFFNERLALLMTGLSNDVRSIRFQEFINAEHLAGGLNMLQLFGFGSPPEQMESNVAAALMAENYLKLPILFAADKLGLEIERIERRSQHGVAPSTIETPAGTIKAGMIGLVSYAWDGYVDGRRFYTTEVYWYIGQSMRPKIATADDFWTVAIEGRPSFQVNVASVASIEQDAHNRSDEPAMPSYIATVVAMLQSAPLVIAAPPGLMLPALPQFHWQPAVRR